ncbi:D-alanyl-D-alanine carboxypeptidase family protein [Conexibacter arvalis]|uniref:D-alanyl-D-alanine carboxypeptidase (Penicillin-binding protein 5/6) n=1 Tax=Conexibacter arvalis TaxID=912552 RepID=A0A840IB32_9ACTN|nr:D-alanyl-D-alanine carboxypeptidase [Conexibacter arvalis]MBB4661453.1 D-alanyl-D-alanine carboxypeptidase (penicillin-binding protein 5/6) [Conexibacter arvalis]
MRRLRLLAAAVVVVLAAVALDGALTGSAADLDRGGGRSAAPPPGLPPHTAAIVADAETGEVLYADQPHRGVLIASTAKLMTALIALERLPLDAVVTAPGYVGDGSESTMGLGNGERIAVADLLRGLLMASGNDAAVALAHAVAGSQPAFVALMNERARELGMHDTSYGNPIGLDHGTRSSAADLVTVTRALRRHGFFRATVAAPRATLESGAWRRTLHNTNRLLGGSLAVDGVKTGHTEAAGYVLVGSATRGRRAVVSVVLGARSEADRDEATIRLLRYGLKRLR